MINSKRTEILILIFCLLLGFGLRFYTFDRKSLWIDEIHTFNDSRDNIRGQLNFYKENPSYLQPPLFFILTHQLYPFTKPERDLRIIPLIFGTLSLPMMYLLARSFSPSIALPGLLALTFMTYHISLSQDGRSYSLLMFVGMAGLYFFMKHLITSKRRYLILVALFFCILFYSSYSSIPFIIFSQVLWLYRPNDEVRKHTLSSFLILNGILFLLCLPWVIFLATSYKGQPMMDPFQIEPPGSLAHFLYIVLHDWVPLAPLMVVSTLLLFLFPILSKSRKNALILFVVFILPIGGLYLFCRILNVTHFITSRYFISFLPLFFVTLLLSLNAIENRFHRLRTFMRLKLLFVILFIASNLIILPLYYRSEKQDFRGLAAYLASQIQDGDKIVVGLIEYIPGLLHYFGVEPKGRFHAVYSQKVSKNEVEYYFPLVIENKTFSIFYSKSYWIQYMLEGNRLWYVAGKNPAKELKKIPAFTFKGYFDGSFLNFDRFPTDASMYLFLWDSKTPREKGIDMPIE